MAATRGLVHLPFAVALAAVLVAGTLLTDTVHAQMTGTIAGVVVDRTERALPGTIIYLIDDESVRSVVTDRFGRFVFDSVQLD